MTGLIGRVHSPRLVRIGGGAVQETAQVLAQLGVSRPLIVTDKTLVSLGHVQVLLDVLTGAGARAQVFDGSVEDPTDTCLAEGLAVFTAGDFDCVIGFGGGSPMDLAKAISAMAVNPGHVRDYKAPHQVDRCGVPIVLVPTTGGTGSEMTRWCVITDTELTEKYNLSGFAFVASAAVIDWHFSVTKPPRITADTAVDSLTHAIEAYVSRKAFAYTDSFALSAMPLIAQHVRRAYRDPGDGPAREALMLGAAQAGMAFSNASVALVHGMSRPIGAHFHVAHGLSNAMLLPAVTAFSIAGAPERYAKCARVMGWADDTQSDDMACGLLVEGLRRLNDDLAVPTPTQLGLASRGMFDTMAAQALASGSPQNNPIVPSAAEIIALYQEVW